MWDNSKEKKFAGAKVNKKNTVPAKDQGDVLKMEGMLALLQALFCHTVCLFYLGRCLCLKFLAENISGRSFGGKKPKSAKVEAPSLLDSSGYIPKRQEFDPEYDNDAEQLLADMEFKENDSEEERLLKVKVLRIYSKR